MPDQRLDTEGLNAAVEAARKERGASRREVARQAGIAPSTLTRLAQGSRPDLESFAALVEWLGVSADDFLRAKADNGVGPDQLGSEAAAVSSLLRVRRQLSPATADALENVIHAALQLLESQPEG